MILQCISRKVAGYRLTALEVHTLVHACCTLIRFTLWFQKPLDIQESTLMPTVRFDAEVALMLVRTPGLCSKPYRNFCFPKKYSRIQMRDRNETIFLAFCAPSCNEDSDDLLCQE